MCGLQFNVDCPYYLHDFLAGGGSRAITVLENVPRCGAVLFFLSSSTGWQGHCLNGLSAYKLFYLTSKSFSAAVLRNY